MPVVVIRNAAFPGRTAQPGATSPEPGVAQLPAQMPAQIPADLPRLLARVEAYLDARGMAAHRFGLAAANSPALVVRLRQGMKPRGATLIKIEALLDGSGRQGGGR